MSNSKLFDAVGENNIDLVKSLISNDQVRRDINEKASSAGWTCLHRACQLGYPVITQLLLEAGARWDVTNNNNDYPIHLAAYNGNTSCVKLLLENGSSQQLNILGGSGKTALHNTAYKGQTDTARVLLQEGADTEVFDDYGKTALHMMAEEGHLSTVKALTLSGANIKATVCQRKKAYSWQIGKTPEQLARNSEVVAYLNNLLTAGNMDKRDSQEKHVNNQEASGSPDIFISYQWGKQPQIKALYEKLTKQGYSCWLDIKQMGGGDLLYADIDEGIRGCKVMLSCVTSKYSESPNCCNEVSLAHNLKKPIIPLLLEKMTWPPKGSMSMVFTQLLYINFCKPSQDIQDHWDCPQMEELLGKIKKAVGK